MPTISVIVPVYNVEPYIHRCVDSILAQTFTDFELILVDDGSPDNCGKICDDYAQIDSRIRVIHQENGGLSAARNAGIDSAHGKYIMFCDSDDYVADIFLEKMYGIAQNHKNAFIVSNLWKVKDGKQISYQPDNDEVECVSYFDIYKRGISAYVCNKIYETELIQNHSIRFNESCKFAEDVGFNTQYCLLCNDCIYISKALYYYVDNKNSIMNKYYPDYFELHLPLFWSRLPLLSKMEIAEYCDIWLYHFLILFNNVFDSRCAFNYREKLNYNQRMIVSKEFRYCLEHASGKSENPFVIKILRTHNYYLFWFFSQLVKFKQTLKGKLKI